MTISPLVYIIILNWNGWHDTTECVESCQKLAYSNHRILIVDNGSTDGSGVKLSERFPAAEIILTGKNLGFAGGNNVGIKHALESGADYVWLLNNDTLVESSCLDYLVKAAESDTKIGMVGCKIYYLDEPETIWFAGGKVDLPQGGLTMHVGKDCRDDGSYDRPGLTGYITGCSVLAKRSVIEDVGLMEEDYFLYFEDADWSLRAKSKGWELYYAPRARLWHKEGAQTGRVYSDRFIYYSLRNRIYFMKRFAPTNMAKCHLLQLRMILYFAKENLKRGILYCLKTLSIAAKSYTDFYIHKRMGCNEKL